MGLQDYVNLFGNGFFPIILVAYFLWKEAKYKDNLKEIITEYKDTIREISNKHEETLTRISESLALMNERIKDIESKEMKNDSNT